jgi:hypothetical protein
MRNPNLINMATHIHTREQASAAFLFRSLPDVVIKLSVEADPFQLCRPAPENKSNENSQWNIRERRAKGAWILTPTSSIPRRPSCQLRMKKNDELSVIIPA